MEAACELPSPASSPLNHPFSWRMKLFPPEEGLGGGDTQTVERFRTKPYQKKAPSWQEVKGM